MKNGLIIIMLLYAGHLFGQNSFQVLFSSSGKNEVGSRILEDNQGNYLIAGAFNRIADPVQQGVIWRISPTGDTLSKTFVFGDSVNWFSNIEQLENGLNMVRLVFQHSKISIYHYLNLWIRPPFLALSAKCTIFIISGCYLSYQICIFFHLFTKY